jgi:hypothetical protein
MKLTGGINPRKRPVYLLVRNEPPVEEHVHVRTSHNARACHAVLALSEDEIRDSTLCIVVAPVIVLVPVRIFQSVVRGSVDVVLHALVPSDLVRSNAVKQLVFLAESEAIGVDPKWCMDEVSVYLTCNLYIGVLTKLPKLL